MTTTGHPGPETWLRELDSELSLPERHALAAHLRDCARCREERERWRARANQARGALVALDVRVDEAVRRQVWARLQRHRRHAKSSMALRWAAMLVLVVVGALALSPPLRAWVQTRWAALVAEIRQLGSSGPRSPDARVVRRAPAETMRLRAEVEVPRAADGWVEVSFAQPAAQARLEIVRGDRTRLQVWGAVDVPVLVAGDRLEVRNPDTGDVRFRLVLGAEAAGVRWRVGSGPWREVPPPRAGVRVQPLR